jgi:hypothetical protein
MKRIVIRAGLAMSVTGAVSSRIRPNGCGADPRGFSGLEIAR